MITATRRPYFAAALTAAAFTITACGGPMPDPATVTDARSVAETRLTNLAAATLVDAPSTVPGTGSHDGPAHLCGPCHRIIPEPAAMRELVEEDDEA